MEKLMFVLVSELLEFWRREDAGIPVGRAPEVALRNNHVQYIVTWYVNLKETCPSSVSTHSRHYRYGLGLATAIMLGMVIRKQPNEVARRVRQNKSW